MYKDYIDGDVIVNIALNFIQEQGHISLMQTLLNGMLIIKLFNGMLIPDGKNIGFGNNLNTKSCLILDGFFCIGIDI